MLKFSGRDPPVYRVGMGGGTAETEEPVPRIIFNV